MEPDWGQKIRDTVRALLIAIRAAFVYGKPAALKGFAGLIIILILGAVAIGLNLVLYSDKEPNNTISAWMTTSWHWFAALPFFAGGLIGHWCSRDFVLPYKIYFPAVFFLSIAVLLFIDLFTNGRLAETKSIWWVFAGFPVGFYFWQMHAVAT